MRAWLLVTILCLALNHAVADDHSHSYKIGEEVTAWLNKVGPYHNPQETYSYYSLPFCKPQLKNYQSADDGLAVVLEGDELADSGILIKFKETQPVTRMCEIKVNPDASSAFEHAIQEHYWYQMYIDELPVWGMVGEMLSTEKDGKGREQAYLYTHKDFSIAYNGDQIVEVNLTSENPRPIIPGQTLPMTYSVSWTPTTKSFASRFDRYLDFEFFEHNIHWFSIFNSFMLVIFLVGLVALILMRTLKSDYARYASEENDLDLERVVDESGWKQVHGDVFRRPSHLMLYSALVGAGWQLGLLAFSVITMAFVNSIYDRSCPVTMKRGTLSNLLLVFYPLTSLLNGYASGSTYKLYQGTEWKTCMLFGASIFPGVSFALLLFLRTVGSAYGSEAAFDMVTMTQVAGLWLFVCIPLVLAGTLIGRSLTAVGDFPCRVNATKRPIPDSKWYMQPMVIGLLSGILPFGSIFIEMYFVFTSFWNYKFYYVYGFTLLVLLILTVVTACVSVVSTYFLLNSEDYRWHWASFFSGGSTALYVFLYSIYYFYTKTRMTGLLQTAFYFGYTLIACTAFFVITGTVGHIAAQLFVRKIYQYIKSD